VHPGDYIIADGSGVVIIPQQKAQEVISEAEAIAATEARMAEEVRKGRPVVEVMESLGYESMLRSEKGKS
jgi:regulator of RNase E activity RraA